MKRVVGTMIFAMLVIGLLSPLATAQPEIPETTSDPVFVEVYTIPRHPIGATWDNNTHGDVITLYANVTNNYLSDGVWIQLGFCNRNACLDSPLSLMEHVSGTLYKWVLPGDTLNKWPYYEASSSTASDIYYWLYADSADLSGYAFYPGPDDTVDAHIYPAWPPSQINSTFTASKTNMYTGQSFWVNGTSRYWNSTSYPKDFSKLLPCDECPVAVKVGPNTYNGKTNIWGNYSVQVAAPATAGSYKVNVTVSNATANRNVPCKAAEQTITVNAYPKVDEVTILLSDNSVYPGDAVTVSGNAKYDTNAPVQTTKAWINFTGSTNAISTNAAGDYSKSINAPMTPGNHVITATVQDQIYTGSKNSTSANLNVETPTMAVTANPNSTTPLPGTTILVQGTATYGNGLAVVGGQVNVSFVEVPALYNNTRVTNALGQYSALITVPGTGGAYTLNAKVSSTSYGGVTGNTQEDIIVTAVPVPDLRAGSSGLTFNETDGLYLEGKTVKITVNVSNTGNAPASAIRVDFTSWTNQTTYLGSGNISLLSPASYAIVELDWVATPGNHTLNATVDPLNTIAEAIETNNVASGILFIDGDADGDNIGNLVDEDDDNDGYNDTVEILEGTDPLDNTSMPADIDHDFIPDSTDPDMDGDGWNNTADAFPQDPLEWADLDGDGIGDNSDPDIDGDGVDNAEDAFPYNPLEWADTDGDGIGNNADDDDDGDGFPDAWEETLSTDPLDNSSMPLDTDGDGAPDGDAANSEPWMDTDDDDDGFADDVDMFPKDPAEWADFDGDGLGDNSDPDIDGDGVPNEEDEFPWDTDNDGLPNSIDSDDDGDGIPDAEDEYPLDFDNDGLLAEYDDDIDGDGVPNDEDAFPWDPAEWNDTDHDGIGDNSDPDIDGDGVPNENDYDPLDPDVTDPPVEEQSDITYPAAAGIFVAATVVIGLLAYMYSTKPKP